MVRPQRVGRPSLPARVPEDGRRADAGAAEPSPALTRPDESSGEAAVRVGGVYALGRLADESPDDRESIEEILATYVRTRAALAADTVDPVPRMAVRLPEVQAALTVLGRRARIAQPVLYVALDLTETDLRRAELGSADLRRVRLRDCLLGRAGLQGADPRDETLLSTMDLSGSIANSSTVWPPGFDHRRAGVRD